MRRSCVWVTLVIASASPALAGSPTSDCGVTAPKCAEQPKKSTIVNPERNLGAVCNFRAVEFLASDSHGHSYKIGVTGEVLVSSANQTAHLVDKVPEGISPSILILNLVVSKSASGAQFLCWKEIGRYTKIVKPKLLKKVTIQADNKNLVTVPVEIVK